MRYLEWEKGFMPDWQKRVRTEGRDKFFYWTAVFGSESMLHRHAVVESGADG
jgi:hypothetical protein